MHVADIGLLSSGIVHLVFFHVFKNSFYWKSFIKFRLLIFFLFNFIISFHCVFLGFLIKDLFRYRPRWLKFFCWLFVPAFYSANNLKLFPMFNPAICNNNNNLFCSIFSSCFSVSVFSSYKFSLLYIYIYI